MKKLLLMSLLIAFCVLIHAEDKITKPKIAVFNFTTIDILGEKLYNFTPQKGDDSIQNSLTEKDLAVIDIEVLGYIKMIDAKSESERRLHDRYQVDIENARNRKRYETLADSILKSNKRSVIIGAEYMIAALARCKNIEVVDQDDIMKTFKELELNRAGKINEAKMIEFAKKTDANYMLYATVADMQVKTQKFNGYNIQTSNTIYSLDLIVKIVDLKSGNVVFATLVTGVERQMKTEFGENNNSDRYKDLLKSAIDKAADKIDARFAKEDKE